MKPLLFLLGLLVLHQVLVGKSDNSQAGNSQNDKVIEQVSQENEDQDKRNVLDVDQQPPVEQAKIQSQTVTGTEEDLTPSSHEEDGYPSSGSHSNHDHLISKSEESQSDAPNMEAQNLNLDGGDTQDLEQSINSKQINSHDTEVHDSSRDSVGETIHQQQSIQPDLNIKTQQIDKEVLKDVNADVSDHLKSTEKTNQASAAPEKPQATPVYELPSASQPSPPISQDQDFKSEDGRTQTLAAPEKPQTTPVYELPSTSQPSPPALQERHASVLTRPPPPLMSSPSYDRQIKSDQDKELSEDDTTVGEEEDNPSSNEDKCKSKDTQDEEEEPAMDLYDEGATLIESLELEIKLRGYSLLETAAKSGNRLAKEKLAYGYIFGTALERNFTRAFELFTELSEQGNPAGQQGLGFMYATGIGMKSNQAKAILHYVFAALGGHHYAQMAMGYRSLMGITVVQSCESGLSYYHKAAKKVVSESSLITGGQAITKVRLMDEENEAPNIYGVSEDDMIHYHSVFADSGNTGAQLLLGMFYLYGMGGAERNFQTALRFLHQADMEGLPAASNLIGKIYAEGSREVPRDYEMAMKYFNKAADMKHGDGFSGLGMMHLNGLGVQQNYVKAIEYFQQAADRGSAEGQYYLGYMYLHGHGVHRDNGKALRYFQLASHGGHLQAIFNLGEMHAEGNGIKRNCNYAAELFKNVAERGKWSYMFMEAQKLYSAGDLDGALMLYTLLSELGFEVAQSNVAFLLEQEDVTLVNKNESLERALLQWNRAAAQGYAVARVKLGDYYYYGQGTKVNYEAAATQYRMASDKQANPQAMFNLGYMYELGLGLEQDYHLAKRYYDMAAETSSEAVVPVNLALMKMNCKYFYDTYHGYLDILMFDSFAEKAQSMFGHSWDIYLISLLTGLVILLVLWRRRH